MAAKEALRPYPRRERQENRLKDARPLPFMKSLTSKILRPSLGRERNLLEDMGGRRLRGDEQKLQIIDDPVNRTMARIFASSWLSSPMIGTHSFVSKGYISVSGVSFWAPSSPRNTVFCRGFKRNG